MSNSALTYTCPNCGAGLSFDAGSGSFQCEFCLSSFDEEALERSDAHAKAEQAQKESEEFCDHMVEYQCPSCGAQICCDEATAAQICYYCHNPVILVGKLSGQRKPDKIIPFRYDKVQAEEKFLEFASKKFFVPRGFFEKSQAEKIQGIYFPFWVTDADTFCTAQADATRVRTWMSGDYRYTETSKFSLHRAGKIHFEDIVSRALSEADDEMMNGILPYPSDALEAFSMPYLSGYSAKKRDVERETLTESVRQKMNGYAQTLLRNTMTGGYATISVNETSVKVEQSHWEYALMPIWILTYQKKGKTYLYAMNGYTGKIYGQLPLSQGRLLATTGAIFASAATLFSLIGGFLL